MSKLISEQGAPTGGVCWFGSKAKNTAPQAVDIGGLVLDTELWDMRMRLRHTMWLAKAPKAKR